MKERILFVDDDPNILEAYQRKLHRAVLVDTAQGGEEGLAVLAEKGPFAVVVADMHMPSMNGIEFLLRVKEVAPDTVRMMLTGNADIDVAMQAVNEGNIFRFFTKPCPSEVMGKALVDGINQYRLVVAQRDLLEKTLGGTVQLMAQILSMIDPDSFGRAVALRAAVKPLAQAMSLESLWPLETAALFSQIGYVTVPHDLLAKARSDIPLTDNEKQILVRVPKVCQELLAPIPRLDPVAEIILYQNKNYDGTGFPPGRQAGDDIPLGSRILRLVTDMVDLEARGSTRKDALSVMHMRKGCYDPAVFNAARAVYLESGEALKGEVEISFSIRVAGLRVGDRLLEDLRTLDKRLLIKSGQVITEPILIRVHNHARLVGLREPIRVKRLVAR